jgi:hypothetical protein
MPGWALGILPMSRYAEQDDELLELLSAFVRDRLGDALQEDAKLPEQVTFVLAQRGTLPHRTVCGFGETRAAALTSFAEDWARVVPPAVERVIWRTRPDATAARDHELPRMIYRCYARGAFVPMDVANQQRRAG